MTISNLVGSKPLRVMVAVGAVRDMALGLGYLANGEYIRNTLLWQHYDALAPGYSANVTGIVFVIVGLLSLFFALRNWNNWVRPVLQVSSSLWLFAALMYFLNGEWALGIYLAGFMSVMTGYLAYLYRFKVDA